MKNNRWKQRPKDSTWGDWGADDQLGRLNLIGPSKVKQAIAEVQFGKSFCLSLPLNYTGGRVLNTVRQPPKLMPVIRNEAAYFNYIWAEYDDRLTDIGSDDVVLLHTQYNTMNGLALMQSPPPSTLGGLILAPIEHVLPLLFAYMIYRNLTAPRAHA